MKLTIPTEVVFEILDGEAVLLNLKNGTYFGLNHVGTRAWELIRDHGSPDRILAALLDEYDVVKEILEPDLRNLLAELERRGLVIRDEDR